MEASPAQGASHAKGGGKAVEAGAGRTTRILFIGFGILWLFDGLLQFLPEQGYQTLAMLAMGGWGQPMWLIGLVDAIVNGIYRNGLSFAFSVTLGAVQAAIGLLMLFGPERRLGRLGLYLSIPAALVIWLLGEWLGGLTGFWGGGITFVNGGPGAVVLYLFGAWLLLPSGRLFGRTLDDGLRHVTGGLWVLGGLLQSVPALWRAGSLSAGFYEGQVLTRQGWWTRPIAWFVHSALGARADALWNGLFVAVMLAIGLGILLRRGGVWLYALAAVWVLFVWWVGENFGAVFGLATTDPNSGPAWAVLLLPLLRIELDRRRRRQSDDASSHEMRSSA